MATQMERLVAKDRDAWLIHLNDLREVLIGALDAVDGGEAGEASALLNAVIGGNVGGLVDAVRKWPND